VATIFCSFLPGTIKRLNQKSFKNTPNALNTFKANPATYNAKYCIETKNNENIYSQNPC
jgi:hypothetical protein